MSKAEFTIAIILLLTTALPACKSKSDKQSSEIISSATVNENSDSTTKHANRSASPHELKSTIEKENLSLSNQDEIHFEYISRLADPNCGDYCSISLIDVPDKIIFYSDLNNQITDLILQENESPIINPKYSDTKFRLKTEKIISEDEMGKHELEVINEISIVIK